MGRAGRTSAHWSFGWSSRLLRLRVLLAGRRLRLRGSTSRSNTQIERIHIGTSVPCPQRDANRHWADCPDASGNKSKDCHHNGATPNEKSGAPKIPTKGLVKKEPADSPYEWARRRSVKLTPPVRELHAGT